MDNVLFHTRNSVQTHYVGRVRTLLVEIVLVTGHLKKNPTHPNYNLLTDHFFLDNSTRISVNSPNKLVRLKFQDNAHTLFPKFNKISCQKMSVWILVIGWQTPG